MPKLKKKPVTRMRSMAKPEMDTADMSMIPSKPPVDPTATSSMGAPSMGMGMKKGGSASSRADGIAQRGKTRGTMVMCGGGMPKGKK